VRAQGFSYRAATRSPQTVPADASVWKDKANAILAHFMPRYNIPASAVVTADETSVILLDLGTRTWGVIGTRSAPLVRKGFRLSLTTTPLTTTRGVEGMQVIFKGKTDRSLPQTYRKPTQLNAVRAKYGARAQIVTSLSPSGWPTAESMADVIDVAASIRDDAYLRREAEGISTPVDQRYPFTLQRAKDKQLFLCFIPPGMTSSSPCAVPAW